MSRLRILVLGSDCNPETVSIPFVTYCHAAALARTHEVTLVAKSTAEGALRRANSGFRDIELVRTPLLDRIFAWCFKNIFRSNYDSQVVTAFQYPFCLAFEWQAWRQLHQRILAHKFDIVLRLVPMSPSMPSPFGYFLRKGPIPFVIGPLNGGLPWPPGFSQLENQKEWISRLRNCYRMLPFARSTYRHAAAIIAASSQTYSEFAEPYRDKLFFVPEPGVDSSLCSSRPERSESSPRLKLIFVGGLVPRKACDIALRAAAPLLQRDRAHFTIVGDGPDRSQLEQLANSLDVQNRVSFLGWIPHSDVLAKMQAADVMVFPSLRDNGAGVVFEALALGAVPIVADFGGPGDVVNSAIGYKVPITSETQMVAEIQEILERLANDPEHLARLRQQGTAYAREHLTWDAKAQRTTQVLNWVARRMPKPDLFPPKDLAS